jgi:hypothetical protein
VPVIYVQELKIGTVLSHVKKKCWQKIEFDVADIDPPQNRFAPLFFQTRKGNGHQVFFMRMVWYIPHCLKSDKSGSEYGSAHSDIVKRIFCFM